MGRAISTLDRWLNRPSWSSAVRRTAGVFTVVLIIVLAIGLGWAIHLAARSVPYAIAIEICLVAVLLAQRSLFDHVDQVRRAFAVGGLVRARAAVGRIVGRDPEALDQSGICRAAIESTAENFSDGVVAPALWYLVLGLPGILTYKMINTADSMIGHRNERYRAFGWAAARLDDGFGNAVAEMPAQCRGDCLAVGLDQRDLFQIARRKAAAQIDHAKLNAALR